MLNTTLIEDVAPKYKLQPYYSNTDTLYKLHHDLQKI